MLNLHKEHGQPWIFARACNARMNSPMQLKGALVGQIGSQCRSDRGA
jgi:hypothetical protein